MGEFKPDGPAMLEPPDQENQRAAERKRRVPDAMNPHAMPAGSVERDQLPRPESS
jgi:hypothetical protein